jgi:hypothetical protein
VSPFHSDYAQPPNRYHHGCPPTSSSTPCSQATDTCTQNLGTSDSPPHAVNDHNNPNISDTHPGYSACVKFLYDSSTSSVFTASQARIHHLLALHGLDFRGVAQSVSSCRSLLLRHLFSGSCVVETSLGHRANGCSRFSAGYDSSLQSVDRWEMAQRTVSAMSYGYDCAC